VKAGHLPSFETLTGLTEDAFYGDDAYDTHYAQARYLCYYLQEQGKLVDFYRRFVRDHGKDPSGFRTLAAVLGTDDMAAFQRSWEAWVLTLTF